MVTPALAVKVRKPWYCVGVVGLISLLLLSLWLTPFRLQLHVTSDPVGARIVHNSMFIGTTPCDISLTLPSRVDNVLISAQWTQVVGLGTIQWAAGIPSAFRPFMIGCKSEDGSAWLKIGDNSIHVIAPKPKEWICISRVIGSGNMEAMNSQVQRLGKTWVAFGDNRKDTIRHDGWTLQIDASGGYCVDVRSWNGIDRIHAVGGFVKQITAITGCETSNSTLYRIDDGPCKAIIMGHDGEVCELQLESRRGPGEISVTYSPER